MNELITIIVPIFNSERYLRRCFESILSQTYECYEVLMIDDGSSDGSLEIMREFSQRDNRFLVLYKNNGGVSSARNVGLNEARGQWITFCDSDDWLESRYLEVLYNAAIENRVNVVEAKFFYERENESYISRESNELQLGVINFEELIPNEENFYGAVWGSIFSKNAIGTLRFDENIAWCEDALFYLKVIKDKSIMIIDEYIYHYNVCERDSLSTKYHEDIFSIIESRKKQVELFEEKYARIIMRGRLGDAYMVLFKMCRDSNHLTKRIRRNLQMGFRKNFKYWNKLYNAGIINRFKGMAFWISMDLSFDYIEKRKRRNI